MIIMIIKLVIYVIMLNMIMFTIILMIVMIIMLINLVMYDFATVYIYPPGYVSTLMDKCPSPHLFTQKNQN